MHYGLRTRQYKGKRIKLKNCVNPINPINRVN